jgi:hypothetical protein
MDTIPEEILDTILSFVIHIPMPKDAPAPDLIIIEGPGIVCRQWRQRIFHVLKTDFRELLDMGRAAFTRCAFRFPQILYAWEEKLNVFLSDSNLDKHKQLRNQILQEIVTYRWDWKQVQHNLKKELSFFRIHDYNSIKIQYADEMDPVECLSRTAQRTSLDSLFFTVLEYWNLNDEFESYFASFILAGHHPRASLWRPLIREHLYKKNGIFVEAYTSYFCPSAANLPTMCCLLNICVVDGVSEIERFYRLMPTIQKWARIAMIDIDDPMSIDRDAWKSTLTSIQNLPDLKGGPPQPTHWRQVFKDPKAIATRDQVIYRITMQKIMPIEELLDDSFKSAFLALELTRMTI